MSPGNFVSAVARVVGLAILALLVFAATALAIGAPAAWYKDVPLSSAPGIHLAILCGLIVWLFVAVFLFKRETIVLPVHDRQSFAAGLKGQLSGLGYGLAAESADEIVFRPAFHSLKFGGAIRVHIEEQTAKVIGPKLYLERLRTDFRVQHHIDKFAQTFRDRPVPADGLAGVQITLRVPGEQWRAVYQQILDLLDRQGLDASAVNVVQERGSRVLPALPKPPEPSVS